MRFIMSRFLADCTADNSWWWAQKMPETCRVLWQNKLWTFDASSWLFDTKLVTMRGHLNIKRFHLFFADIFMGLPHNGSAKNLILMTRDEFQTKFCFRSNFSTDQIQTPLHTIALVSFSLQNFARCWKGNKTTEETLPSLRSQSFYWHRADIRRGMSP